MRVSAEKIVSRSQTLSCPRESGYARLLRPGIIQIQFVLFLLRQRVFTVNPQPRAQGISTFLAVMFTVMRERKSAGIG